MQINELKKNMLKLLKEDEEFRFAVAGLIGYGAILEELREYRKRFEEHDRKFNAILAKLAQHDKRFEGYDKRFEEHDKKFNAILAKLAQHDKRFEEHDKKFNAILEELKELRKIVNKQEEILGKHSKAIKELSVSIGSLGKRLGKGMEKMVLNIYRDQLLQLGIDPNKARRFRYKDEEGKYGLKGMQYEFDIVISNEHVDVLEVKSYIASNDVVWFYEKVDKVKDEFGKQLRRRVMVAVNIDKDAYKTAKDLGIYVIYGHIIR